MAKFRRKTARHADDESGEDEPDDGDSGSQGEREEEAMEEGGGWNNDEDSEEGEKDDEQIHDNVVPDEGQECMVCELTFSRDENIMLICDGCDRGCHAYCLDPNGAEWALRMEHWYCADCQKQEEDKTPRAEGSRDRTRGVEHPSKNAAVKSRVSGASLPTKKSSRKISKKASKEIIVDGGRVVRASDSLRSIPPDQLPKRVERVALSWNILDMEVYIGKLYAYVKDNGGFDKIQWRAAAKAFGYPSQDQSAAAKKLKEFYEMSWPEDLRRQTNGPDKTSVEKYKSAVQHMKKSQEPVGGARGHYQHKRPPPVPIQTSAHDNSATSSPKTFTPRGSAIDLTPIPKLKGRGDSKVPTKRPAENALPAAASSSSSSSPSKHDRSERVAETQKHSKSTQDGSIRKEGRRQADSLYSSTASSHGQHGKRKLDAREERDPREESSQDRKFQKSGDEGRGGGRRPSEKQPSNRSEQQSASTVMKQTRHMDAVVCQAGCYMSYVGVKFLGSAPSEMPKFFANGGRGESSPFKDEAKIARVDIVHLRPAYHLSRFKRQLERMQWVKMESTQGFKSDAWIGFIQLLQKGGAVAFASLELEGKVCPSKLVLVPSSRFLEDVLKRGDIDEFSLFGFLID
uniref:PHD-type domain-containing protein n=1 Tax=Guillardia theta TaxID=55529 RepID=A0A7S4UKN1_GUITH